MTAEPIEDVWIRMPRGREWTWVDLQDIPDDGHRYEIIDGSLHVSASPTPRHQLAASRLTGVLVAAAPDDFEVVPAVDIDLGTSVIEPDLLVVPSLFAYDGRPKFAAADILLAVEVVSPSSVRMDRLLKPSLLAEAGVPAYWRVEVDGPDTPTVVLYELAGEVYREVGTVRAGESVRVDVPFPVDLRPAELAGPRRRG